MKKLLWTACLLLCAALWLSVNSLRIAKAERDRYKGNADAVLREAGRYRTKDSLNVLQIQQLRLKVKEYKRYREEDAELIKTLQMKGRDLTGVTSASTRTKDTLWALVRDTIIQRDSVQVNAQCVDIIKPYIEMHGCVIGGEFDGYLHTYDSILVVESVKRKRFLGFLWKTRKVKDRRVDVLSRNPRTTIASAEVVTIEY